MSGPLEGVRIVDMTSVLMGPFASLMLGDMGADIIKVEAPAGDITRQIGPQPDSGMGPHFMHNNRNKRSIVLDLKKASGKAALLKLCETADVLMYNVRPQAMARLGLGYEVIAQANPRIIYVGAFGFDQQGPYAAKPAYDDLIQGSVGVPSLVKRAGSDVPRYVPTNFADRAVGQRMAVSIAAALYCREKTGKGQAIEVPMFETMIEFVMGDHLSGLTYEPAAGASGYPRLLAHERKPYATADGHICAVVYNDKHWQSFLALIGRGEMFTDDVRFSSMSHRTKHINEVYGFLADILKTRTTAEWLDLLNTADIPVMPMHSVESLLEDPHLQAIDFFKHVDHPTLGKVRMMSIPTRWSESKLTVRRHAPELGEQSVEILREAGYDDAAIGQLLNEKAAYQNPGKQ